MKKLNLFILIIILFSSCSIVHNFMKPMDWTERPQSSSMYAKRAAFTEKHGAPRNPLFDPPKGKPVIWR